MYKKVVILLSLFILNACSIDSGGVSVAASDESSDTSEATQLADTSNDDGPSTPLNQIGEMPTPLMLEATHRSGQTFLTWPESDADAQYNVYRHNLPITRENLDDAFLLNERWGPLDADTSVNALAFNEIPSHFVISDLSPPLSDDTGLFVYTVPNQENTNSYYAITSILNGAETTDLELGKYSLAEPVQESVDRPRPVLTRSTNSGKGRIYTQFMDYSEWNPTLNGYAYNYTLTLPHNYDPTYSYPLQLHLHAFGESFVYRNETEYQWEFIKLSPSDPGTQQNTINTWWYGFAADHNYATDGDIPLSGNIENFTEQRVLEAVKDVLVDSELNVDENLVHVVGHSMGASGALAFGLRYPEIFSGVYASQPMTNYRASPTFQDNFIQLWGHRETNLRIVNKGFASEAINHYNFNGSTPKGVWSWMNHIEHISNSRSADFSFLMIDHGKEDNIIDWDTQGQPLARVLSEANIAFSYKAFERIGHTWLSFSAVTTQMFGLGFDDEAPWKYPNTLSFPALSYASGSSAVDSDEEGDSLYNTNFEWSTSFNDFDEPIVDKENIYEISLRSTLDVQTANITPRNTQLFRPMPNQQCSWIATDNEDGLTLQTGTTNTTDSGLITIDNVTILTGTGTRLAVLC